MTEREFKSEMLFLKISYSLALEDACRNISNIRNCNVRAAREYCETNEQKFLNSSVYIEDLIQNARHMLAAEKRTVDLYREHHKLD